MLTLVPVMHEHLTSSLEQKIQGLLLPHGYELVALDIISQREKVLRLYIDKGTHGITLHDCVFVSQTLNEPLDLIKELEEVFGGAYELEVSSPGLERPLRKLIDFDKFNQKQAKIHLQRPLKESEATNKEYWSKNSQQKTFLGLLAGIEEQTVLLDVITGTTKKNKKNKSEKPTPVVTRITLPFTLIKEAHLEPSESDFQGKAEGEVFEI